MKKFFSLMIVLVLVAVVNTGCMTHYANFQTSSYGSGPTRDGGWVSYSRTESYSYDSGYREYYGYQGYNPVAANYYGPYVNGHHERPLPPPHTEGVHIGSDTHGRVEHYDDRGDRGERGHQGGRGRR